MKPQIKLFGCLSLALGVALVCSPAFGQSSDPFKLVQILEHRPDGTEITHAPDTTITVEAVRTWVHGSITYSVESKIKATVDKDEFLHDEQVILTGDFTIVACSPNPPDGYIGKYRVGGQVGSIGGPDMTPPWHQTATGPSGGQPGWTSQYFKWEPNSAIEPVQTHTLELTHIVKENLATQSGTAEYYMLTAASGYYGGAPGEHYIHFIYFRGAACACDPPVVPEPLVPEGVTCETGGITEPPGSQTVLAPPPLLSHGIRVDFDLLGGMSGGDCQGCGSGSGASSGVPLLNLGRYLYPNNQHVIGNSSPGHVFNFDHRLRLYHDSVANVNIFTLFDANTGNTHWGDDSDTAGTYEFEQAGYYTSFNVVNSSDATVTDLTTLSDINPLFATVQRRGGWEYKFQIVDVPSGGGFNPMGRLLLVRSPDGYETTFTYKTFTPTEITESPRRLLQIDTITDPGGNVATLTYHTSQQAGRWVISQISINGGDEVIDYTYNGDGQISSVSLNSEVKSTYSYGFDSTMNAATIVWYERLWTTNARDVLFLSPNYSIWGGELVNQFADVLLARGEGATNPNSPPEPYFRVHRSTGTPGLYRINDRQRIYEWYRGRYKKYFETLTTSDYSAGFDGYVGTFEATYAEHRNSSGGAPTEDQVLSGKHPIVIDETGYAVTITYDSQGYVTRKDYYDSSYEKFLYDSKGRPTYFRNRDGFVTTREYDTAGRIVKIAQGLDDQSGTGSPSSTSTATQRIFGYYASGSHTGFLEWTAVTPYSSGAITPPSSDDRTDFAYGAYGQIEEMRTPVPAGQTARPLTQFDWEDSRLDTIMSPLGTGTVFTYDALRRTIEVLYPDASTERVHYDDTNGIVLRQNRVGVIDRSVWNNKGHLTSTIAAYGRSTTWPTVDQVNDVNNQSVTTYAYFSAVPQNSIVSAITHNGSQTSLQYDYRGRNHITDRLPRSGIYRRSENSYVNNLLFKTADIFGGYTNRTYFGHSADRQTIREISTRAQDIEFADNAAILAATRLTGTDPAHAINDTIRDPRGNVVEVIDPIGTITLREYDPVGRNTLTTIGHGLSNELTSENEFNGKGQLIEQLDAAGTITAFTYDAAGNVQSKTAADGTGIAATWTYTYYLDGRQATETQPNSGVTTDYYSTCCGKFIGTENALGHGQISNSDAAGRTVHDAVVEDFSSHTDPLNPINGKTLTEVTTKYRDDGRVAATTQWKDPLGAIDPNNPPIAGLGSIAASDGVTTQYLYDNRISDGVGLDSSGGITLQRLGGGTADVNIQAAVTKLADTVANGGAEVEFTTSRSGKATVAISPDEKTMNVSIQDAMGRTVFRGLMTGPAATTPNQLVYWTCTAIDKTYSLSGVGLCEAVWQISQDGKDVKTVTDGFGNQVVQVDQLSKLTRMKYNSAGSLIQHINPLSQTTSYEYDALGRQTKAIDPQSNASETVYHATNGRVTSRKDAKNQTVSYTYDALGRVLTTTDRTSKVTTQTYTNMGQVATVTDAESRVTGYGYNLLGQRISTTYSDSGQQTIDTFDAAGRPLQITKPSGRKHNLTYNLLGNVTQIQFKNTGGSVTETQTMTYDAYGRETGVASSQYSASTAKSYNDLGQLATEATTYSGETYTVSYAYNTQGRLNEMTYPSGKEVEYTYDDRQQLETISWQGSQVEDRSYNDIGLLTGVDRAYVDETRTYTAAGRVNTINSNNVGSMTYSYDANGNVTGETLSGNMANYTFTTVSGGNSGYDGEDRFMRFIRSGVSEDIQLTRSDIGNISNVNLNGGNTARGYNSAHGLTSVGAASQTYDSDGNTTTLHTNVTTAWDDAGRAKHTNTPTGATAGIPGFNEYGYVGGLRVWKKITRGGSVVEHRVFIHAGPNVIAEYNAGVDADTPVQEYVYADQIDSLVLIHRSDSTKYGVSRNRQWSVIALHDLANGSVVERYAYEMTGKRTIYAANGTTVRTTSSYSSHFGYTNRWHDEESGLMYFRARYYNPLTGEFLSRDPMEFVDGMSLYRGYFGINAIDPTGTIEVFFHGQRGFSGSSSDSSGGSSESSDSGTGSSDPGGSSASGSSEHGGSSDSGPGSSDSNSSRPNSSKNQSYPLYRWADRHFSWSETDQAVKYIIDKVGKPDEQCEPIVLAGHSFGGWAAMETARKLHEKGYSVDLLATLDPVTSAGYAFTMGTKEESKPSGAKLHWNWYQTKTHPHGTSITNAELNVKNQTGIVDGKEQILNHTTIDDDRPISDKIRERSEQIHKQWVKPECCTE